MRIGSRAEESRDFEWHDGCVGRCMSKPIPTIQKYMTTSPHSIGVEQTLAKAHAMMREHNIRHLPVLHGQKLMGLVTERDLRLVESLKDVDPTKVSVEEAMSTVVYSVTPDSPLDEVVSTMAERKYGSAIVMQNGKVVGIFTTVDVCRAFAELLQTRLAK
jgi:acetoin utilization protein AcuB